MENQNLDFSSLFSKFLTLKKVNEKIEKKEVDQNKRKNQDICQKCGLETLIEDNGIFVCTSCGSENGVVISTKQEWRSFNDGKEHSRCGMSINPFLQKTSLGTVVGGKARGGYTKLQLQHANPTDEKPIRVALNTINKAASELGISQNSAKNALYLYSRIIKGINLKRGPVRKALMASCQFIICMKDLKKGDFIAPERLSEAYEITIQKFNEGYKLLIKLYHYKSKISKDWDIELKQKHEELIIPTDPEMITRNVCKRMDFTDSQIAIIVYITRAVKKLSLLKSKMPQSVAAGCILFYIENEIKRKNGNIKYNLDIISNFCTVSLQTAKNVCSRLQEFKFKKYLFPGKKEDLENGRFGNCYPEIDISKIYKNGFETPTIIIDKNIKKVKISRGRPKKKKLTKKL